MVKKYIEILDNRYCEIISLPLDRQIKLKFGGQIGTLADKLGQIGTLPDIPLN